MSLPRFPVRFVPQNAELLKSEYAGSTLGGTDYKHTTPDNYTDLQTIQPQYRVPTDRPNGNDFFRRYPNGTLDLQYATNKVITAIHNVCEGVTPTTFDQICLAVFYPAWFSHPHVVDSTYTTFTMLKISSIESMQIMVAVAAHMDYARRYSESSHSM